MDRTATFYSQPSYVQRGGGLPVYSGPRRQRGGSVLGTLKGFLMPFLGSIKNKAMKRAKTEAFGLVKDVAADAISGKNIVHSVKRHGVKRAKQLGKDVVTGMITGAVSRKRSAPKKKSKPPPKKRRINNF